MIRIFINGLAASAGGGLTYLRNVLPRLGVREEARATALLTPKLADEIKSTSALSILKADFEEGSARRFWHEQFKLPELIRRSGADVLLSPGNIAVFRSPVPQILLSRNALYTSSDFTRDLRNRGEYRMWMDTAVKSAFARWSVSTADCTVAPSRSFAGELERWTGKNAIVIHHGLDHETFLRNHSALPYNVQSKLEMTKGALRLLFVSHYNYYRNFETLFRTIAILKKALHPREVRLLLTCKLNSVENPGCYRAESAAELVRELRISDEVVELGSVPYNSLHQLYCACDFYVTAAYAETFAHPLVEAMACGVPVIASDLPVHREICGEAALYFSRFSPRALAENVIQLTGSTQLVSSMREKGRLRSRDFSWDRHVDELLVLAWRLANGRNQTSSQPAYT
jgi:glycosyltransferase involved in cell wall biosynthesis